MHSYSLNGGIIIPKDCNNYFLINVIVLKLIYLKKKTQFLSIHIIIINLIYFVDEPQLNLFEIKLNNNLKFLILMQNRTNRVMTLFLAPGVLGSISV